MSPAPLQQEQQQQHEKQELTVTFQEPEPPTSSSSCCTSTVGTATRITAPQHGHDRSSTARAAAAAPPHAVHAPAGCWLSSLFLEQPDKRSSCGTARGACRSASQPASQPPSLLKFYPGSEFLERQFTARRQRGRTRPAVQYLSLWLLPPPDRMPRLSREIAQLSHSIRCDHRRHAGEMQRALRGTGPVPCRFAAPRDCRAMYTGTSSESDSENNNNSNAYSTK